MGRVALVVTRPTAEATPQRTRVPFPDKQTKARTDREKEVSIMWTMTQAGFVSAVQHRDEPSQLMVRARDAQSLISLAAEAGVSIHKTPHADYPYRVTVTKQQFACWMTTAVDAIDYPNFKGKVARTRAGAYLAALHRVWGVMHDIEDPDARKSTNGGC